VDGQGTKCRKNIAENLNRLSRLHERYRQTTDRQTDGRATADSERNVRSRSLIKLRKSNVRDYKNKVGQRE